MTTTRRYLYPALFLLFSTAAAAQGVSQAIHLLDTVKIPSGYTPEFRRQLKHDAIDKEQQLILFSDGKNDKTFSPSPDEDINYFITQSLVRKVDVIQYLIETDKEFD